MYGGWSGKSMIFCSKFRHSTFRSAKVNVCSCLLLCRAFCFKLFFLYLRIKRIIVKICFTRLMGLEIFDCFFAKLALIIKQFDFLVENNAPNRVLLRYLETYTFKMSYSFKLIFLDCRVE